MMKKIKILSALIIMNQCLNVSFAADSEETKQQTKSPVLQSARMVWLDPKTGKLLSKPPAGTSSALKLSASEANAMQRSDEGLEQVVMPDGHVMVDLQGRYQHFSTATVGTDGKAKTHFCGMNNKSSHDHQPDNGEEK